MKKTIPMDAIRYATSRHQMLWDSLKKAEPGKFLLLLILPRQIATNIIDLDYFDKLTRNKGEKFPQGYFQETITQIKRIFACGKTPVLFIDTISKNVDFSSRSLVVNLESLQNLDREGFGREKRETPIVDNSIIFQAELLKYLKGEDKKYFEVLNDSINKILKNSQEELELLKTELEKSEKIDSVIWLDISWDEENKDCRLKIEELNNIIKPENLKEKKEIIGNLLELYTNLNSVCKRSEYPVVVTGSPLCLFYVTNA